MEKDYSYCRIKTELSNLKNCEIYTSPDGELGEIIKFIFNIVNITEKGIIYDVYIIVYNTIYDNLLFNRIQTLIDINFKPIAYSWLNRKKNKVILKIYS